MANFRSRLHLFGAGIVFVFAPLLTAGGHIFTFVDTDAYTENITCCFRAVYRSSTSETARLRQQNFEEACISYSSNLTNSKYFGAVIYIILGLLW